MKNLKSVVGGPILIICGLALVACAPTRFDRTNDRNDLDNLVERVSSLESGDRQAAECECDVDTSEIESRLDALAAEIAATNQRLERMLQDVVEK